MERRVRREEGRLPRRAGAARLLPVLLVLALPAAAADFSVTSSGPRSLAAEPRGVLTVGLAVENGSRASLDLLTRLVLPAGWKRLGGETAFTLAPGEADTRLVSFLVPQGAQPGLYEIPLSVERQDDASAKAVVTFTVVVSPRWKVEVKLLAAPDLAMAGADYEAVFSVLNASNAEAAVLLSVSAAGGLPYSLETDRLVLASGASAAVRVTGKVPQRLAQQVTQVLVLRAMVEQAEEAAAEATGSFAAIPVAQPVADAYWSLPLTASLSSAWRASGAASFYGIRPMLSADGSLDEEGRTRVSLLLRPAAFPDASSVADQDEYRLGLRTDAFSFVLGDAERSFSPLLAPSLWGRGLDARAGLPFLEASGLWIQPPGGDATDARYGARLAALLPADGRAGLQWLQGPDGSAASALLRLSGPVKLQAECGLGEGRSVDGTRGQDSALIVDLLSALPGPSWSLKYLEAGPRFPGAYRDLEVYSAGVNIPVRSGLTATASLRQETHNLERDAARGAALQEGTASFGMDGRLGNGLSLSVSWRSQDRRDLLPDPDYGTRSDTVRFDLGKSLRRASVGLGAELSRTEDLRNAQTLLQERYSASVEVSPETGRSVKGVLSYDADGALKGARPATLTTTISASLKPGAASSLAAELQWKENPASYRSGSAAGKASYSYVFPGRETVSAQAGLTVPSDPKAAMDAFLQVDFRIPLSVPIARRTSIGTVRGRVLDAETGTAVTGALLRIGAFTAVSDEAGAFRFPGLKPGAYFLNMDLGRLGYDRITTKPLPFEVAVEGAGESTVELSVTRKATLAGTVAVQGVGGLAHAMLELSGEGEAKRTYTDASGRFSFPELRPGTWVLRLPPGEIPEYSDMDRNNVTVVLAPGDSAKADLTVIPRKRTIRMIEEGTVQEEESKP